MPLNFPTSPTLNQTYTYNGRTWKWNGAGWEIYIAPAAPFVTSVNGTSGEINVSSTTGDVVVSLPDTISANITGNAYSATTALPLTGGALTGGLREARVQMATANIDCNAGNYFTKTISTTTALTVSNVPAAGTVASFILDITNAGTSVSWWSGIKWSGGIAPTLTASGRDVLGFFTHDGGTTWNGFVLGKDVK